MTTISHAAFFNDCHDAFYGATPPEYLKKSLTQNTYPLCFDGFATMYSGVSKTPFWSAEHLTRRRLTQADTIPREDSFHEESRLPKSVRATLSDYSGSGYDRGHIAPNADMANISQQYDSFSLANIAPQSPRNNRYIWRNIESATRYLTQQYGEVYVVTGVAFTSKRLKKIGSGVLVPSHFFKAVYIPAIAQAGVYYAPNDESERIEVISIDELALRIGIDVMPAIESAAKSQAFDLPLKAGDALASPLPDAPSDGQQPWWLMLLAEIFYWLIDQLKP
ncbi:MAG: DNA/RNA non-specific endonuclease [Psychrobacter sp.]|nr:DNA/RNA non-specific endonuclease [Psychrobacter sp.]